MTPNLIHPTRNKDSIFGHCVYLWPMLGPIIKNFSLPSLLLCGIKLECLSLLSRECFCKWVFVPNWPFFNSIFCKSIQITELKNLFNYSNWISISIQHFLYQIKSNKWTVQAIEFFNIKSPNFFEYRIDTRTNSAFYS